MRMHEPPVIEDFSLHILGHLPTVSHVMQLWLTIWEQLSVLAGKL